MSAHQYRHRFSVRGSGRFPVDMLRYDNCKPVEEGDADRIERSKEEPHKDHGPILLETVNDSRHWEPTYARWSSFLWGASSPDTEPVEARAERVPVFRGDDSAAAFVAGLLVGKGFEGVRLQPDRADFAVDVVVPEGDADNARREIDDHARKAADLVPGGER